MMSTNVLSLQHVAAKAPVERAENRCLSRPDLLTQRVHPLVFRCLALISLALSIPAFVVAFNIFQRGGAGYLTGTIAATLAGTIFAVAALGAFRGARRSVRDQRKLEQPSSIEAASRWSSARARWSLAICCCAFSALFFVPTAITFVEWRSGSGPLGPSHPIVITFVEGRFDARLLGPPQTRLPPIGCIGGSTVTFAFFAIAVGLIYRRHRYVAWGLLLFLVSAVSFTAYEVFFHPVQS